MRLDALLRDAVARARRVYYAEDEDESFHGLYISEQEVDRLFAERDAIGSTDVAAEFIESSTVLDGLEALSAYWQFSAFEHAVILLALAPEVDLRYERIFAYLQDDVTRRKPTVDLALNLLAVDVDAKITNRKCFLPDAPLLKSGLLRLLPDPGFTEPPLLSHYLRLDEYAVRLLLGDRDADPRTASFCDFVSEAAAPGIETETLRRLRSFLSELSGQDGATRFLFGGSAGSLKKAAAETVASTLGVPLLTADLWRCPNWKTEPAAIASLLVREASRAGAALHVEGVDSAPDPASLQILVDNLTHYTGTVAISSSSPAVAAVLAKIGFFPVEFSMPNYKTRSSLWQRELASAGIAANPEIISTLANHFIQDEDQIASAVEVASQNLKWLAASNRRLVPEDVTSALLAAARAQSGSELSVLTSKLQPVYRWQDIVLPQDSLDQLNEICQRIVHSHDVLEDGGFGKKLSAGKGVAVLFAGPSGTGKTMAAEVIANELGLDLYRIDLSTVVSKYIGETEKNLERIFDAATRSNAILLFDEADALCGRRSEVRDAHDRYANIEISYLLQKMEQYEGITILTTNLRGNLDEAFVRRLAFTVHFPFPEEADRLHIWKRIWPEETRLDPDLDFSGLAKHFRLSGGNIKNIALATAFLAAAKSRPVRMSDILHATRREYEKVGKVLSTAEIEAVVQ